MLSSLYKRDDLTLSQVEHNKTDNVHTVMASSELSNYETNGVQVLMVSICKRGNDQRSGELFP